MLYNLMVFKSTKTSFNGHFAGILFIKRWRMAQKVFFGEQKNFHLSNRTPLVGFYNFPSNLVIID